MISKSLDKLKWRMDKEEHLEDCSWERHDAFLTRDHQQEFAL